MSFGGFSFGKTAPAAAAPAGSTAPATQPTPSFSFGTPQAQQSGNAAQGTSAPGQSTSGGLFGGFGQNTQQNQTQTQTQQPAAGGSGLFGGGTSSLFGAKPAQPATGATGTSSLFGGTSSLFGGQQQQQQQQQGQTQQQPQQTSSLFGQQSTTQQPTSGLFGGGQTGQQPQTSVFGNSSQQPQQNLQASTSSQSAITKTTKFTDLPENYQKEIEAMDAVFRQQKDASNGVLVEGLGEALRKTRSDVKVAKDEQASLQQSLKSLQSTIDELKQKFIAQEQDLQKVIDIVDAAKAFDGRQGVSRSNIHRDFPQDFFARAAERMDERVGRYRKTISQLQRAIQSLYAASDGSSPQGIVPTIQNHEQAILYLAARVEQVKLRLDSLRYEYTEIWRENRHSMRSPFEVAREEQGLPSARA